MSNTVDLIRPEKENSRFVRINNFSRPVKQFCRLSYGLIRLFSTQQEELLYLPTQIRFLIGGERVTCHWSKLNDALGQTKLNDAVGQQHLDLELSTCT